MKKIIYNITSAKGIKLTQEPLYLESGEVEIELKLTQALKKYSLTATISTDSTRESIAVKNNRFKLPLSVMAQGIVKFAIKGELQGKKDISINCEPIEIKSLANLTDEVKSALPDYAKLPDEVEQLKCRVKKLESVNNALIALLNDKYALTIKGIDERIRKLEASYDIFKQ